jgi:hypothetical protein
VAEAEHVAVEDSQELHLTDRQIYPADALPQDAQIGSVEGALVLGAVAGDSRTPRQSAPREVEQRV